MQNVAIACRRKDGEILPFTVHQLSRVPSVDEIIAGTYPPPAPPYRVIKVVHLLTPGDEGRIAEIYCEEITDWIDGFEGTA